ncbi:uncharacterized protein LOC117324358 [Pecten maximus]|uniref:uncharacterized protein LOC117324358 n=1 Tax=Pecten maximus TaxID=6579 RepID=UPI0014583364|nr:uncharacterized protein LOC117324358 [Pecten maximus]
MILWIRYAASVLSLALVYEFIVSSPTTARRLESDQIQTQQILNKQHMESILTNIPEKINLSFRNYLRGLENWTRSPMKIVQKLEQLIQTSTGSNKYPHYPSIDSNKYPHYPSIDRNLTSSRTDHLIDRMSVLLSVLLRELHRHGSNKHTTIPQSDINRTHPSEKCERTKRELPSYLNNGTSLKHAQTDEYQNASLTEKQNVSGQFDDNERITILPLTESVDGNESTSTATSEVTTNRRRVKIVRKSRRRAYRSRVITPKRKKKPECQTILACIHPYISYLAGTIMFILVVYLIIVFGKCVCDDSF